MSILGFYIVTLQCLPFNVKWLLEHFRGASVVLRSAFPEPIRKNYWAFVVTVLFKVTIAPRKWSSVIAA